MSSCNYLVKKIFFTSHLLVLSVNWKFTCSIRDVKFSGADMFTFWVIKTTVYFLVQFSNLCCSNLILTFVVCKVVSVPWFVLFLYDLVSNLRSSSKTWWTLWLRNPVMSVILFLQVSQSKLYANSAPIGDRVKMGLNIL